MTAPDSDHTGRRFASGGWLAVFVFMLLYGIAYLDRQVINLLVDQIKADLQITDVQISMLQGFAFVVSFSLCSLPLGWVADRYPRRWLVFIGISMWSISASAAGLARAFPTLILARMGVGAGEAALAPAAYSMLAESFPRDRLALPMGVFSSGAIIGQGVSLVGGGLIVGWALSRGVLTAPFVGELHPWQLVFLITGLPGLLLGSLVFLLTEPPRAARPKPRAGSATNALAQLRRHPVFYLCHFLGFSILGAVAAGWGNWAPTFLIRTFGWPVPIVGLTLGLVGMAGGITGMLASSALADALFRRGVRDAHLRIYVIAALVLAISGMIMAFARSHVLLYASMTLSAVITSFIAVAAAALQIATPPHLRGQISTMFLFVYNLIAYGLGPLSIATFTDLVFHDKSKIAFSVACHFGVLAPLAAVVLFLGLGSFRRAAEDAANPGGTA